MFVIYALHHMKGELSLLGSLSAYLPSPLSVPLSVSLSVPLSVPLSDTAPHSQATRTPSDPSCINARNDDGGGCCNEVGEGNDGSGSEVIDDEKLKVKVDNNSNVKDDCSMDDDDDTTDTTTATASNTSNTSTTTTNVDIATTAATATDDEGAPRDESGGRLRGMMTHWEEEPVLSITPLAGWYTPRYEVIDNNGDDISSFLLPFRDFFSPPEHHDESEPLCKRMEEDLANQPSAIKLTALVEGGEGVKEGIEGGQEGEGGQKENKREIEETEREDEEDDDDEVAELFKHNFVVPFQRNIIFKVGLCVLIQFTFQCWSRVNV